MGNVANLRNMNDFLHDNTLNMGWRQPVNVFEPLIPGYPWTESGITDQIENIRNRQTIRLLKKHKFRNIEYI